VWLRPVTVWEATLVFSLCLWTSVARTVRARVATLVPGEYVQAARSLGASESRVFFRHLLPNALGTIVVCATALVGQILLIEATSEFFGYGVASIRRPTLGNLIAETTSFGVGPYNTVGTGWWVWAAPAGLLVVILACVNSSATGSTWR
jgi:peptide/nickel transport system permease protein